MNQEENKSEEVLFSTEIADLQDDNFEGSNGEHCVFREVFFMNNTGGTNKKNLVNGINNFEREHSHNTDTSVLSKSENSVITSQSSSKNLRVEENENATAASASCSLKRSALKERNDQNLILKRVKLSVDNSNANLDMGKAFNCFVLQKEVDSGTNCVVADSDCRFLVVESSGQGVTYGCYLLGQHAEKDRNGDVLDQKAIKCGLQRVATNDGKEAMVGKAIASPVSQESFANKLLAASPSINVPEKSGSPLCSGLDVSDTSLNKDPLKDPRPLLQDHVVRLLTAAGWGIEKRKRPSRKYAESVYRSPIGRPIREFSKAWRMCGQILFTDRYNLVQEDEEKKWNDMSQFWSDLSETLLSIEKEIDQRVPANALADWWSLLDPFVTVVFVDRKIGSLRKGDIVKVTRNLMVAKHEQNDSVVASRNANNILHQFGQRHVSAHRSDSCMDTESALTVSERTCHAYDEQSQYGILSGYGKTRNNAIKCLTGVSVYVADGEGTCLIDSASGTGNQCCGMSFNNISSSDTSLPACGSCSSCLWVVNGPHDAPVAAVNIEHVLGGLELASLHRDSNMNSRSHLDSPLNQQEMASPKFPISGGVQQSTHRKEDAVTCMEALELKTEDKNSSGDLYSKKKTHKKSRKISEIKLTALHQSDLLASTQEHDSEAHGTQFGSDEVQELVVGSARTKGCEKDTSSLGSHSQQVDLRCSKFRKTHLSGDGSLDGQKKSAKCRIKDDDLLVSAIIKNKAFSSSSPGSTSKAKAKKSRARTKLKGQKGSCRLLPRGQGKGEWSHVNAKRVLSWLLDTGVISLKDGIQYRNPKDDSVVKDGLVTRDGIICGCCSKVLSVSEFKSHAGFKLNRSCLNLFMESGHPFTLCQLQAWSAEYKTRRNGIQKVQRDDYDQNDDSCGLCGDVGELICCDNCPSAFHLTCLSMQVLPEGSWYCSNCTCWICGELAHDKGTSVSFGTMKCSQCKHKYHEACLKEKYLCKGVISDTWFCSDSCQENPCLKEKYVCKGVVSDTWFCSDSCQEIYSGLQSRIGILNQMADGFSWTIIRCIHEDQKVHSVQRFALKAECNSKLAVALTIMEECFQSMVDARTGVDMIPQVLYNWGSDFSRLNFHGFHTVILEKDDVLISVASIRLHGTRVAEMPLIATCSNYRRQGMCRRLVTSIEEMLISFKVEKLVVAAIPDLVETWTQGFGFTPVDANEKATLNNVNLMVFPGTILLKKSLYDDRNAERQTGLNDLSPPKMDLITEEMDSLLEVPITELVQQSNGYLGNYKVGATVDVKPIEGENKPEFEPGNKIQVPVADEEPFDKSSIETTKLGICSEEQPIPEEHPNQKFSSDEAGPELEISLMKGKNFQEFKDDAQMEKLDFSKLSFHEAGAKLEGKNVQEFEHDAQMETLEHTEQSVYGSGAKLEIGPNEGESFQEFGDDCKKETLEPAQKSASENGAKVEIRLVEHKEFKDNAEMEKLEPAQQSVDFGSGSKFGAETENRLVRVENLHVDEGEESSLQVQFSKLSCEVVGGWEADTVSSEQGSCVTELTQVSSDKNLA